MSFIKCSLLIFIAIISLRVNAADQIARDLNASIYFEKGERELKAKNYAEGTKAFIIAGRFYLLEAGSSQKEEINRLKLSFLDKIQQDNSQFKDEIHTAHVAKGLALLHNHSVDEAMAQFDIALNLKPDYAEAYLGKGDVYLYSKKNYAEALRMYDLALKYKPNYVNVYISKGTLYADYLEEHNKAIEQYDLAIMNAPNDPLGYFLKAQSLDKLGRIEESKILVEKAKKLVNK